VIPLTVSVFPKEVEPGFALWAMRRQNHVLDNDADIFRPECWLEATPKARSEMAKVQMLVFRTGKWTCLGKTVALMELSEGFVEILRRFDVAIVDPTRAWTSANSGSLRQQGNVRADHRAEGEGVMDLCGRGDQVCLQEN
jgi:cytochrome P450